MIKLLIKSMRPSHWIKNSLIFVPLILSGKYTHINSISTAILTCAGLSILASGTYIINDLLDIKADKIHPINKKRPIASGELSKPIALITGCLLIGLGLTLGIHLSLKTGLLFFIYLLTTLWYSLKLKKIILVDIFILAFLHVLRLFIGASSTHIPISEWLFIFSFSFFLGIATLKRVIAIKETIKSGDNRLKNRGYTESDLIPLQTFGIGLNLLSVLILMLYLYSPTALKLYKTPQLGWIIVILLLFWKQRLWILAERGRIQEDPIKFVLKDKKSFLIFLLIGILIVIGQHVTLSNVISCLF